MCEEVDDCRLSDNLTDFAFDVSFPASSAVPEEPMGIALDGHIIVGPYNEDGEIYTCADLDGCNGAFLSDNSYAYVLSKRFPYIVGCWGPADIIKHPVETSCAPVRCEKGALSGLAYASSILAAAIVFLNF